ncbi:MULTISPECIES: hypothetical protein [Nostoc]|nr:MULTISPECIES: hypothetical protein [Nostoc]
MASDSSKKTIFAAMGANLAIAIAKFIAAFITINCGNLHLRH